MSSQSHQKVLCRKNCRDIQELQQIRNKNCLGGVYHIWFLKNQIRCIAELHFSSGHFNSCHDYIESILRAKVFSCLTPK